MSIPGTNTEKKLGLGDVEEMLKHGVVAMLSIG
jgi:hypothetical protein